MLRLKEVRKHINELKSVLPKNTVIIPLPIPLTPMSFFVVSILIAPLIWIVDKLLRFDLLYVRLSLLAYGILLVRSLSQKTLVKLMAIMEDEDLVWRRIVKPIYSLTDRIAFSKAFIIGVNSPLLLKKLVLRRRTLPKGKVVWVPPGVDREKIEAIKRVIKSSERSKRNYYVVGFVGLLAWWQGVDILVKTVAEIKDFLDKPVKLLIVGDGPERRKIEFLCRELKVDCTITGFIKHEEALKLMKELDVLVVPSIRMSTTESNIPIKVLEAWALGVPVIATRHEIYEFIGLKNFEDIVFCEPEPEDIAHKILILLSNESLRKKIVEKSSKLVERFCYDRIVANILNTICR